MDFHKQYRSMNENITPSDALVQQTIAKMESGRPHRARKPLKIILAVAAALACVSTAVAANQEAVLRVLYQIAPGMAEYLQPVGGRGRQHGKGVFVADRHHGQPVRRCRTGSV